MKETPLFFSAVVPDRADTNSTNFVTSLEYTDMVEVLLRQCGDNLKRQALGMIFLERWLQAEV